MPSASYSATNSSNTPSDRYSSRCQPQNHSLLHLPSDPKGYLTSLSRNTTQTAEQVGDIKRVRELLESVIRTNPKHGPGWIAAARLEELAGKMGPARSVISRGCEYCPKNEDVWLEALRLNETTNAKIIVANAVKHNPKSVRLWVEAEEREEREGEPVAYQHFVWTGEAVECWEAAESHESKSVMQDLGGGSEVRPPHLACLFHAERLGHPDEQPYSQYPCRSLLHIL